MLSVGCSVFTGRSTHASYQRRHVDRKYILAMDILNVLFACNFNRHTDNESTKKHVLDISKAGHRTQYVDELKLAAGRTIYVLITRSFVLGRYKFNENVPRWLL